MQIDLKGLLQGLINVVIEEAERNEEFHQSLEKVILDFMPTSEPSHDTIHPVNPQGEEKEDSKQSSTGSNEEKKATSGSNSKTDDGQTGSKKKKGSKKTTINIQEIIKAFQELSETEFLANLDDYNIDALKQGAKQLGIIGYSTLKKTPLMKRIYSYLQEHYSKAQTETEKKDGSDSQQQSGSDSQQQNASDPQDQGEAKPEQDTEDPDKTGQETEEDLKSTFYNTNPIIIYIKHGPEVLRRYLDSLTVEELRNIIKKYKLDNEHRTRSWSDPVRLRDHIFNRAEVRATQGDTFYNFDG